MRHFIKIGCSIIKINDIRLIFDSEENNITVILCNGDTHIIKFDNDSDRDKALKQAYIDIED